MLKKIKGLIVQDKDKNVKVLTSVFAGSGANEDMKANIVKGLEKFGFSKQEPGKKSNPDWENYATSITGNTKEELEILKSIIENKERQEITLGKNGDEVMIVKTSTIPADGEKPKEKYVIDGDTKVVKYIGIVTYTENPEKGSSIGLIFSSPSDDPEKMADLESMGMNAMQRQEGADEKWSSYSIWINKPSEEEIDIIKNFPTETEGKYKKNGLISLEITDYSKFKIINNIVSIDEIPEKASSSEAEENAPM